MNGTRSASEDPALATWMPPAIVAAIAVAIVSGFYLGGPGLGMAVGGLAVAAIVVLAVREAPRGPIEPARLGDLRRHMLVVSRYALEDSDAIAQIKRLTISPAPEVDRSEIRVLIPARGRRLDRWSGERRPARSLAQRECVISLASLGKAGLAATASVGEENVVLAIEDELRTFPATDVVLVSSEVGSEEDEAVAAELRSRLQADFLHLAPNPSGGRDSERSGAARRAGHRRR